MDSTTVVGMLIMLSLAFLQSTAETRDGSVFFIDSSTHQHLSTFSSGQTSQTNSMSVMEVGAVVLVLLGLAPPPMLSHVSSSKLNELLMPNPFTRPRHVFLLEVALADDSRPTVHSDSAVVGSFIKRKLISSSPSFDIELPGREEVSFFSLDGPDLVTDEEISDFVQSFGGSYMSNSESQNGELIIPLPSGFKVKLHMSKKADRKFVVGLMNIIEKTKMALERKQDFPENNFDAAELMTGYFDGIKALQEEYGSKVDIAEQAMDLFLITISKLFDSLQEKYEGQIVAVILFSNSDSTQHKKVLDVTFASRASPRWLEEAKTSANSTVQAEVALVRITLAWFTGIVLLIATLIGVYLLVNMPLTRDTLLYSNVKLD